jgi:hypothetical protein
LNYWDSIKHAIHGFYSNCKALLDFYGHVWAKCLAVCIFLFIVFNDYDLKAADSFEFPISTTYSSSVQRDPSIAVNGNGDFIVVWDNFTLPNNAMILARRFSSSGLPMGAEFQVNTSTARVVEPEVASSDAGDFVIVWRASSAIPVLNGIFARRFDSNGNSLGDQFEVAATPETQTIAMNSAGDFIIAWEQGDGDGEGIWLRRYSSGGMSLGSEFQVNLYTTQRQTYPSVSIEKDGSFIVVWNSFNQDLDGWGMFGRRYDPVGLGQGEEFQVNTYTNSQQRSWQHAVSLGPEGDFMVAWMSQTQDGSGYALIARRFGSDGQALSPEFQVNEYTTSDQVIPWVSHDAQGRFLVVWNSYTQDGDRWGVYARHYGMDGAALECAEIQVNLYTTSWQYKPAAQMDRDGNAVVVWTSRGQGGGVEPIYGRVLGLPDEVPPNCATDPTGTPTVNPSLTVTPSETVSATATATYTSTLTATATEGSIDTPTAGTTPTGTATKAIEPSPTNTAVVSETPAETLTETPTPSDVETPPQTATETPTQTATAQLLTATPSVSSTGASIQSPTNTPQSSVLAQSRGKLPAYIGMMVVWILLHRTAKRRTGKSARSG